MRSIPMGVQRGRHLAELYVYERELYRLGRADRMTAGKDQHQGGIMSDGSWKDRHLSAGIAQTIERSGVAR